MKPTFISILTRISFMALVLSLLSFVYVIYLGSEAFTKAFIDTAFGNSPLFLVYLKALSVASITSLVFLTSNIFYRDRKNQQINIKTQAIVHFFKILLTAFLINTFWLSFYPKLSFLIKIKFGYFSTIQGIAGTGSMYPTFPKGQSKSLKELASENVGVAKMLPYPNGIVFQGKRYFSHQITRGDIVVFESAKTREISEKVYGSSAPFIKRVIGIPGDTLEIRDGLVFLNGGFLSEPYIAHARSTFGGEFLNECKSLVIPKTKLFVMGDNRKASGDSRSELGLIHFQDIQFILPVNLQKGYLDSHWRSTATDTQNFSKIKIDQKKYLDLINTKRSDSGQSKLELLPQLQKSAELRGQIMLKTDDFSFAATRSGYTIEKAMKDVGYSNIIWAESWVVGYYEADELFENLIEKTNWQEIILNPDFQDFGIAEVEGNLNGCPTQVVIQHFGGYKPPNYSQEVVASWKSTLAGLREIQSGWEQLKSVPSFYEKNKKEIDRINEIISLRITRISQIVSRFEANQWLTADETRFTEEDAGMSKEQNELANKLNSL